MLKIMQNRPSETLLHANSDVHSRRLFAESPKDGLKCLENCNHIVQI